MRAKVLVRMDREAALNAIRTLDALNFALSAQDSSPPKRLRKKYIEARQELADAIGQWGFCNGVVE